MLMWISGLQKVLLGRFLGPKFGDLGVQFGDLGAQIEVPEGPLGAVLAIQKPFVASWDVWSLLGGLLEPSWRPLGANKPPRNPPEQPLGSQHGCISLSRLIRATRVTQLDKSSNERIKNQRIDLWMRRRWINKILTRPWPGARRILCKSMMVWG